MPRTAGSKPPHHPPAATALAKVIVDRSAQGEAVTRAYLIAQGFAADEIDRHIDRARLIAGDRMRSRGLEPVA
jgi:hypothetical protein